VKVLENSGRGDFRAVEEALDWILENRETYRIGAVCMSLGDGGNYENDGGFDAEPLAARIHALHEARVAVAVAAGNDYYRHDSRPGMSYPAILRETVSVGAVYDGDEGPFRYRGGAEAFGTGADRITPFSQRLHETVHADCRTDVFAPGAPVTSSGIENDRGESVQQGTSQAAPVTAGVILLLQELHLGLTGRLPEVPALVEWMRRSGAVIHDGDDETDNVRHTGLDFRRVDAYAALDAVRRALQRHLIDTGTPLR
jgi:subtilisin family serine protease